MNLVQVNIKTIAPCRNENITSMNSSSFYDVVYLY